MANAPKKLHVPIFSTDGSVLNKKPIQNPVGAVPFNKGKTVLGKYKDHTEIPRPPDVMVMALIKGDVQGIEFSVIDGEWKSIVYRHSGAESDGVKQWIGFTMDTHQYRVLLEKNQGMSKEDVDLMMRPADFSTWFQRKEVVTDV